MKFLLTILTALILIAPASAQPAAKLFQPSIGVNGVWYDEAALPGDFEAVAGLAMVTQPILAFVSQAAYGFEHEYVRGSAGVRITTTDPFDPVFSLTLGTQYHISTDHDIRPQEWAGDVGFGYRPFTAYPAVVLGGQASYGFDSKDVQGILAVRYKLGGF